MLDWKSSQLAAVVGCPHRANPSHYFIPSLEPTELERYPNAVCEQNTVKWGSKSQGCPAHPLLLPHRPGFSRQGLCDSHGSWPMPSADLKTQGWEVGLATLHSSPRQSHWGPPCHFLLFISLFCSIWHLFIAFPPTFPPDNLPQSI